MEDSKIIELYFAREESAIAETDKKYGGYCRTIAYRILQNLSDSEECVNDTWLRAWNVMPPQRPRVLRQFLAKITRNVSLDRWRGAHAEKRGGGEIKLALEELAECADRNSDPATQIELAELKQTIGDFLQSLSNRERDIFLRRYFYLEKPEQIARSYWMKTANIRLILSRTRQKLRQHLQKEGLIG